MDRADNNFADACPLPREVEQMSEFDRSWWFFVGSFGHGGPYPRVWDGDAFRDLKSKENV